MWGFVEVEENIKLAEAAEKQAHQILNRFASKMRDLAEEIIGDVEVQTIPHIETDAWMNYRSNLRSELQRVCMDEAKQIRTSEQAWAKNIRDAIYKENVEEIRNTVIKDLETQVANLKNHIEELRNYR